jgi:predicted secreted protein
MSAGIGIVGRQVLLTIGGITIIGTQNKGMTCNNERLDCGDDQAEGWAQAMAIPGEKAVTIPISGVLKNLGLMAAYFNGGGEGSQIFECQMTYPDGSVAEGDFFMDSFSETGEYKGLKTFDASFSSSGEVVFTAGSAGS